MACQGVLSHSVHVAGGRLPVCLAPALHSKPRLVVIARNKTRTSTNVAPRHSTRAIGPHALRGRHSHAPTPLPLTPTTARAPTAGGTGASVDAVVSCASRLPRSLFTPLFATPPSPPRKLGLPDDRPACFLRPPRPARPLPRPAHVASRTRRRACRMHATTPRPPPEPPLSGLLVVLVV